MGVSELFVRFARAVSRASGRPAAFMAAALVIVVWMVSGPLYHFSDTWQLVINTGTTIVTFLMVFLIQNTQNRDSEAMHLKLDELIRAVKGAKNSMLDVEELTQQELDGIKQRYSQIGEEARGTVETAAREDGRAAVREVGEAAVRDPNRNPRTAGS